MNTRTEVFEKELGRAISSENIHGSLAIELIGENASPRNEHSFLSVCSSIISMCEFDGFRIQEFSYQLSSGMVFQEHGIS